MDIPSCGSTSPDHELHNLAGRVELAALLASRVSEIANEVLVSGAKEVGELEVLVAETMLGEVVDEVTPLLVGHRGVADLLVEVDVLKHAFKSLVGVFECGKGFVEPVADLVVQVGLEVGPAGGFGDEERVVVEVPIVGPSDRFVFAATLSELLVDDLLAFDLEHVGRPLQEQGAKDVLLELGRIHLSSENVCRRKQMTFQLRKGKHRSTLPIKVRRLRYQLVSQVGAMPFLEVEVHRSGSGLGGPVDGVVVLRYQGA